MCKFCEDFEFSVSLSVKGKHTYTYSVAYLDHVIVGGKVRSRTIHYMKNGIGYPLRFCPECGKKLLED